MQRDGLILIECSESSSPFPLHALISTKAFLKIIKNNKKNI